MTTQGRPVDVGAAVCAWQRKIWPHCDKQLPEWFDVYGWSLPYILLCVSLTWAVYIGIRDWHATRIKNGKEGFTWQILLIGLGMSVCMSFTLWIFGNMAVPNTAYDAVTELNNTNKEDYKLEGDYRLDVCFAVESECALCRPSPKYYGISRPQWWGE